MPWPTAPIATEHDERPTTFSGRLLRWLGGWHPAAVHFPIALLLTAAFLELMAIVRRKPIYAASNKLLLAIATLGAFVAAPLGWVNAGLPAPDDEASLTLHRWIGAALPFLVLIVWRLAPKAEAAAAGGRPHRRCARRLGVSLPSLVSHARRHVSRRRGAPAR